MIRARSKSPPETEPQAHDGHTIGEDEALAARGDTESFILLYRSYLRPVYSYLYARVGNRQEAEDLTSIAFERAWQSFPSYRPTGSFKGWLFTIASRTLADHRRREGPTPLSVDDLAESLRDPARGPEETAVQSDQLRYLLNIIAKLTEEQQEVISLRFMAELRYSEISRITGKSEAAVKMTAYRALEEIKRRHNDA